MGKRRISVNKKMEEIRNQQVAASDTIMDSAESKTEVTETAEAETAEAEVALKAVEIEKIPSEENTPEAEPEVEPVEDSGTASVDGNCGAATAFDEPIDFEEFCSSEEFEHDFECENWDDENWKDENWKDEDWEDEDELEQNINNIIRDERRDTIIKAAVTTLAVAIGVGAGIGIYMRKKRKH